MSYGLTHFAGSAGGHAGGRLPDPLSLATWLLLDRQGNLSPLVTSGRTTTGTYFDATGTLQTAAIGVPRVSYDPADLSAPPFVWAEEARTNLAFPSNLPTSGTATIGNVNINGAATTTSGATFPGGVGFTLSGADSTVNSIGNGNLRIQGAITAATTYTFSCWMRTTPGQSSATLRLRDVNTETAAPTLGVSTSQWRFVSRTVTTAGASTQILMTTGGTPIDIFNLQVEIGATASSPILTYGTAVTRSADNLSVTNLAATGFNAAEGTIYVDAAYEAAQPFFRFLLAAASADNTSRIALAVASNTLQNRAVVTTGGTDFANVTLGTLPGGSARFRSAMRYATNDVAGSLNGGAVQTDTTVTLPSNLTYLGIGLLATTNANARIFNAAIIPQRIPDSALQRLTR